MNNFGLCVYQIDSVVWDSGHKEGKHTTYLIEAVSMVEAATMANEDLNCEITCIRKHLPIVARHQEETK